MKEKNLESIKAKEIYSVLIFGNVHHKTASDIMFYYEKHFYKPLMKAIMQDDNPVKLYGKTIEEIFGE